MHILKFSLLVVVVTAVATETCPIAQYYQFSVKENLNPFEIIRNPYKNKDADYL